MSQTEPTQTLQDTSHSDLGFRRALLFAVAGFAVGTAAGATVMYLADPDRGRRRRALAKDQLARATGEVASSLKATASDVRNRSKGWMHEAGRKVRSEEEVDDATLKARVRSALGHSVKHPHSVVVSCDGGKVTLAGPIVESETDELLAAIRRVPGVRSVRDLLERHESAEDVPTLGSPEAPAGVDSEASDDGARQPEAVTH